MKAVQAKRSKTRKRKDVNAKAPMKNISQVVKIGSKIETTDEVRTEVPEGASGSLDCTNVPPIEVAPSNPPSDSLPAIAFQPETFSPVNLPPELAPEWVAPVNCGLEEWVLRAEKLAYWADGIGRLDALVTKRHGESLWYCRDWFRQRKEKIKVQGKKLKDETMTWTKLLAEKKWDRATVSRKIKFYLEHRNTPDDQLHGQSICNMWSEDAEYMQDPPALGQFYRVGSNSRQYISDDRGNTLGTQINVDKGTVIEVAGFNDSKYNDTVVRIKSGMHTGKCFTTQGVRLSDPVDDSKVADLVKEIEDARKAKPKKGKSKKSKSKGVSASHMSRADAQHQGQLPQPAKEGKNTIQDAIWTPVDAQQPLSEDCKEGLAQLVSFMAFLVTFKPTLHEYTLLSQKLDEVCNYYHQMREQVVG